jgi:N-acetylneuraminic acid mutarotase
MRSRSLVLGILAVGAFGLTACTEETATEPSRTAEPSPTAPELAVVSNSWTTRENMWGTDRYDLAATTVTNAAGQSILYAIGGRTGINAGTALGKVMAYNTATDTWITKASLPTPLWGTNGAAVLNGKIYISGGCAEIGHATCVFDPPSSALFVYDPSTNTWARNQNMPSVLSSSGTSQFGGTHGATGVIAGRLYVLTECYEAFEPAFEHCSPALFFRYNPVTDKWTVLPRPVGGHDFAVGGVIDGKFYATGFDGQLEVYDPATNHWTTKTPLPNPHVRLSTGAVAQGRLFVIGGQRLTETETPLRRTIAYDPTSNTWITKAPMPTARVGVAASRVFVNGQARIEVVGGIRPGNNLQYIP